MKRTLFCIAMLIMSVGCAEQRPVDLSTQAATTSPGFATLADANDPIDMAAAPVATKIKLIRYSALKKYWAKKIGDAQVWSVQNCADTAINILNRGILEKNMGDINTAKNLAVECEKL